MAETKTDRKQDDTMTTKIIHTSYEKMAQTTSHWSFDAINNPKQVQWVVTEKVHGANFCFHYNGNTIRCAKRRSLLNNESFFSHELIVQEYKDHIIKIYNIISKDENYQKKYIKIHNKNGKCYSLSQISVYGELFGGYYPISNDNSNHNDTRDIVQKEIYYCDHVEIYPFDIALTIMDGNDQKRLYMNYEDIIQLFEHVGFKIFAKPIFIGKMHECLNYNTKFITKIPTWLGLKSIEHNYGEGIVIRTMKNIYYQGSKHRLYRAIVKHKNELFHERVHAYNNKYGKKHKNGGTEVMTDMHMEYILNMINKNRFTSAHSKLGKKIKKNNKQKKKSNKNKNIDDVYNMYVNEIIQDCLQDLINDNNKVTYWYNDIVLNDNRLQTKLAQLMHNKALDIIKQELK